MSAAVKPSTGGDVTAFIASVGLHAALLAVPLVATLYRHVPPPPPDTLPNNVAMVGNSIEVDAPTPEVAPAAAAAPEAEPEPVDVKSLPEAPPPLPKAEPASRPDADGASKPKPTPSTEPPRAARKPASKPKPSTASAEASSVATPSASTTGTPAAGTFGQEGLAPGVRRLGYAFTRNIPPATKGDPAWLELPVGHVGTIRVELEVDANNHLGAVKRWHARPNEPTPPPVLERLLDRTLILMRTGQFALSNSNDAGTERLVIDVEVRDEPAAEDADRNVVQLQFDPATPGHPNRAYFRYGTGRAVEAKVTTVRSGN